MKLASTGRFIYGYRAQASLPAVNKNAGNSWQEKEVEFFVLANLPLTVLHCSITCQDRVIYYVTVALMHTSLHRYYTVVL